MDEKHVGTELKAALSDLRQLATQLAGASREWWDNRRHDMNPYEKQQEERREAARRRERDSSRGYGEGYGMAGIQRRPREEDWEDEGSYSARDDASRWARGRETDDDVRGQYGVGGGRDPGGWSQRHGGRERSGFSEYGRGFDDSDLGQGARYGDRESGYYAREGGDYSQGYGRQRDPGRIYGPEDFSQRYEQGHVFSDSGYGDGGRWASGDRLQGNSWRGNSSRDFGGSGIGISSGRNPDFGSYQRDAGQYKGSGFRGRGPRGYRRSDERIAEDLNERLTDDHHIDASDLQVSVSGGVVTLSGTVDKRWMKHRAEDLAESCTGVTDVRNEIRVQSSRGSQSASAQSSESESMGGRPRSSASSPTGRTTATGTSGSTAAPGTGAQSGNPPGTGSTH